MDYIRCAIFSLLIGILAPMLFVSVTIEPGPISLPKIGLDKVLAMDAKEAKTYVSNPENMVVIEGFQKYWHYAY